jgi:NADPH:quinone reductase-like Zn-dependent oxidoreductase
VIAEYVLLSEQGVLAYPDYLTPAEASTLPVAAITAWVALFKHGNLKPGETVLLQGSGGVSLFALQLAVAHGARVLVTSRSPGKIARLKQLGATEVIDTSANAAWDAVVLGLTHGRGADHVLDVIGGDAVPMSIQVLFLVHHREPLLKPLFLRHDGMMFDGFVVLPLSLSVSGM